MLGDALVHLAVARLGGRDQRDARPGRLGEAHGIARLAAAGAAGDERQRHGTLRTPSPRAIARGHDGDVARAVVDEPHAGVVVLGDRVLAQHLGRRAGRDRAARREQEHAVGVLPREREVVHRRDDGQAGCRLLRRDELEHVLLVADVERARRLVEQQQPGALGERTREHGALQLAARERGQRAPGQRDEIEPLEHLGDGRVVGRPLAAERPGVRRAAEQHVVGDGRERRHDRRLRHERDATRELAAIHARDRRRRARGCCRSSAAGRRWRAAPSSCPRRSGRSCRATIRAPARARGRGRPRRRRA